MNYVEVKVAEAPSTIPMVLAATLTEIFGPGSGGLPEVAPPLPVAAVSSLVLHAAVLKKTSAIDPGMRLRVRIAIPA